MKLLKLIFSRIYYNFYSNKLVFVLFALGCFVCAVSFTYLYGNTMPSKIMPAKDSNINYFSFNFNNGESLSELISKDVFTSELVNDVRFYHNLTDAELPPELNNEAAPSFKLGTGMFSKDHMFQEMGRVEFTEEENNNAENVIILPQDYNMLTKQVGESINVCGQTFKIIGFHSGWNQMLIPQNTMLKINSAINSVELYTNRGLSRAKSEDFISEFKSDFSDATVSSSPIEMYDAADSQNPQIMFLLSVVYMISVASFMFLMKYMMDKSRRENIIYSIVGAKKKKVILILLAESSVIITVFSIFAVLVHFLFYDSFFSHINTESGITYNINDYLLITVFMIVLSLLTSIPFVVSYMKNSLVENKIKYSE